VSWIDASTWEVREGMELCSIRKIVDVTIVNRKITDIAIINKHSE